MGAPLELSAEAATADEAHASLQLLLHERLQSGAEVRSLKWFSAISSAGWLPDDDLTCEWLQNIQAYRAECDANDRKELDELEQREADGKTP